MKPGQCPIFFVLFQGYNSRGIGLDVDNQISPSDGGFRERDDHDLQVDINTEDTDHIEVHHDDYLAHTRLQQYSDYQHTVYDYQGIRATHLEF